MIVQTPSGHIVIARDGSAFATSPMVANDIANALFTLVEAMSKDLSALTGLTPEEIIEDYYDECELDLMNAAYNAVLRREGLGKSIPKTRTRIIIEDKLKQEEK